MFTKTQEKILSYLLGHSDKPCTIRALAKWTGVSYPLCYHNIQELLRRKILAVKAVPPAHIISLHEQIPQDVLVFLEIKRTRSFIKKHRWIELLQKDILRYANNFFCVIIIFGSYAKGKETKLSDLDLLLIVPSKQDVNLFENAAQQSYTKVKKHCIVVTMEDFITMLSKSEQFNVGNEARKHHILLYGAEQYYKILEKVKEG